MGSLLAVVARASEAHRVAHLIAREACGGLGLGVGGRGRGCGRDRGRGWGRDKGRDRG